MKRNLPSTLALILILQLMSPLAVAQNQSQKEVMTNASVIELVKLGLGEAVIIQKIRQSERKFDTSNAGLAQLKAAKVSDNILMEMMNSGGSTNGTSAPTVDPNPANGNPSDSKSTHDAGIYVMDKNNLTEVNPTVFQGTKMSWWKRAVDPTGLHKTAWRAVVRGASANTQVSSSRPEFYFYFDKTSNPAYAGWIWWFGAASSPGEFTLVKMQKKDKTREAVLGEFNAYTMSTGARDKDIVEFTFEKIRSGAFKVVPKSDLLPGEYCFYYAATPQGLGFAGGRIFDFTVLGSP
jgi:hypothetical protein